MTTFQSACKACWQKLSEYAVLGRPIFDKAVRHSYVILFTSHTIMHEPSANQNRLDSEKCDTQHFKERNPTRWKNSLYDRKKTVIYHTRMTPIGSGYLLNKTDIYLIMKRTSTYICMYSTLIWPLNIADIQSPNTVLMIACYLYNLCSRGWQIFFWGITIVAAL